MVIKDGNLASSADVIESVGNTTAQLAYEQVKSDATNWTNTDYLGADVFTDADGAKNTVDTTNSTAFYDVNNTLYQLTIDDESSGDTLHDPDSMTNPSNAFDGDYDTYADKSADGDVSIGRTFASKTVGWVAYKATGSRGNGGGGTVYIESYDGATWNIEDTQAFSSSNEIVQKAVYINSTCEGIRVRVSIPLSGAPYAVRIYEVEYGDLNTSNTVETNTVINEIVPDSIVVYGKADLPTNTSITVDVSDDGGSTFAITGQSLNTAIDTSTFTTGDIALKFNLATTDTSATPKLYGYGVALTDY